MLNYMTLIIFFYIYWSSAIWAITSSLKPISDTVNMELMQAAWNLSCIFPYNHVN